MRQSKLAYAVLLGGLTASTACSQQIPTATSPGGIPVTTQDQTVSAEASTMQERSVQQRYRRRRFRPYYRFYSRYYYPYYRRYSYVVPYVPYYRPYVTPYVAPYQATQPYGQPDQQQYAQQPDQQQGMQQGQQPDQQQYGQQPDQQQGMQQGQQPDQQPYGQQPDQQQGMQQYGQQPGQPMGQPGAVQQAPMGAFSVTISNFQYSPSVINVPVGATVTWVNQDSAPHTVTGTGFDGMVASGQSYSYSFTTPGRIDYYCRLHPTMRGTVVVGGAQ